MVRASSIALSIVCGPIVCAYIAFAACFCPARLRRYPESEEKKRFERRQKMAPRPLPVRPLERSLTLRTDSSVDNDNEKEIVEEDDAESRPAGKKTKDQTQSRLMRLPLELREMIWRAVLGDSNLHLVLKEQKLGYLRCKAPTVVECPLEFNGRSLSRESCWGTTDGANIWSANPFTGIKEPTDGDIVPLLRTCRQIYSEAIPLLYTTNTFSIADLDVLRYFSSTILPKRFHSVRHVHLSWSLSWPIYDALSQSLLLNNPCLYPPHDEATWEETWRIISEMQGLEEVKVRLGYFDGFRDPVCEAKMLAPLWKVGGEITEGDEKRTLKKSKLKTFEVHVTWEGEELEGAPFKLMRPPNRWLASSDSDW